MERLLVWVPFAAVSTIVYFIVNNLTENSGLGWIIAGSIALFALVPLAISLLAVALVITCDRQ